MAGFVPAILIIGAPCLLVIGFYSYYGVSQVLASASAIQAKRNTRKK
jgi:hypothetical protein